MANEIQETIDALIEGSLPFDEVRKLLESSGAIVRVNALRSLVGLAAPERDRISLIVSAVKHPSSSIRLMGTTTVAHEGIACLYRIGTPGAILAAERLIADIPTVEREDLLWYLHAQELLPRELAKTG